MRILCLTSRLPYPPNRGDRLRAFNFIKHLSQEHELSLISFIAHESERQYLSSLQPYLQDTHVLPLPRHRSLLSVLLNLWRPMPFQALYYRARAMQKLIDKAITNHQFDAVYMHLFRMAPYMVNHSELYRIVDLTDVISREVVQSIPYRDGMWRLIYMLERPRIERYERFVAAHFDETWLVSEADRQLLTTVCPQANIQVIPNGVDTNRFYPTEQPYQPGSLVFVGHLRVFHNIDAATYLAREILPQIRQQIPDCTLHIVGANPAPEVSSLAQENKAINVTGFVPDLNAYLNRSAVFVAPLRFAAGVQNKVLEAMAAACPVVTTPVVNAGLGAQPGKEVLVADGTQAIVIQILRLLRDEKLRNQIGRAGYAFVRRNFKWHHVVNRMHVIEKNLSG